jgi:chromate transporter
MIGDLWELLTLFARLSFAAFGGGVGIVPQMQREVVARGWLTQREFVEVFALGQVTPGPGMLISTVIGYRVAGLAGALVAGVAMFLPSCLLTWVVSERWGRLRHSPVVANIRAGMAPVGLGLIASGAYAIGRTAIDGPATALIALAVTLALLRYRISPAVLVALAGAAGWLLFR